MTLIIRHENADDIDAIARLTEAAFLNAPHASHSEARIVGALRRRHRLTLSLVAIDEAAAEAENGPLVGHVAISPVTLSAGTPGWHGLGPVSVQPQRQGRGIGSALISAALTELRWLGGLGCVVLGDPGYYKRFGFKVREGLELPGVPPGYFQALAFGDEIPTGSVRFDEAFDVAAP